MQNCERAKLGCEHGGGREEVPVCLLSSVGLQDTNRSAGLMRRLALQGLVMHDDPASVRTATAALWPGAERGTAPSLGRVITGQLP